MAAPLLLVGGVVGVVLGALITVVVRYTNPTFNATTLVVSALAGVAVAAFALTRWMIPVRRARPTGLPSGPGWIE